MKGSSIEIRYDAGGGKGKGMFVVRDADVGEVLFVDRPLVAMQSSKVDESRPLICEQCFRYIDVSLMDQMVYFMTGEVVENTLRDVPSLCAREQQPSMKCCDSCSSYYCSTSCQQKSWDTHHVLMCEGQKDNPVAREWMERFYQHARQTNDIFILAAKAISSMIIHARDLNLLSPEEALYEAWKPYQMGYKQLWWESVARPDDIPPSEESQFRSGMYIKYYVWVLGDYNTERCSNVDLKELAMDSFVLFAHAIELGHPQLYNTFGKYLLHIDIWGSLVGMFELNNLSILATGPKVLEDVSEAQLKDMSTLVTSVHPCDEEECRDIVEDFVNCLLEGTGFYPLHSCMNHSCIPNCRVMLPQDPSQNNQGMSLTVAWDVRIPQ